MLLWKWVFRRFHMRKQEVEHRIESIVLLDTSYRQQHGRGSQMSPHGLHECFPPLGKWLFVLLKFTPTASLNNLALRIHNKPWIPLILGSPKTQVKKSWFTKIKNLYECSMTKLLLPVWHFLPTPSFHKWQLIFVLKIVVHDSWISTMKSNPFPRTTSVLQFMNKTIASKPQPTYFTYASNYFGPN